MTIKKSLRAIRNFFLGLAEGSAISTQRLERDIKNGRP